MKKLFLGVLLAVGCGKDEHLKSMDDWRKGAPKDLEARMQLANPALGESLYQLRCMACHGPVGAGDGPAGAGLKPRPADLRAEAASSSVEDIYLDIAQGKTATAMPAWSSVLKEDEIVALVAKVRRFKAKQP